jgi:hypothetical protein
MTSLAIDQMVISTMLQVGWVENSINSLVTHGLKLKIGN